ncbi:hypothetical protein IEQ34_024584 [Dendrobium chrysotoxum]|uniref:Uncharacterized protein n=1 Tax=Dendrobium chrysotoxum TaxID=161865 RepID=A0AAV7FT59_DENCH|nr:hypothetical protein IEQ34_024584 [Dendrobium chrysotoxum]
MKRDFGLVILPKKTKNSATKPLIPGNAREAIEKLLNMNVKDCLFLPEAEEELVAGYQTEYSAAAQFLIYVGAINVFICCDVHERFRIWTAIRLDCSCILWLWVVSQLCGSRFSDIQAASEPAQFALIFLGRGSGGSKAKRALLEGICD